MKSRSVSTVKELFFSDRGSTLPPDIEQKLIKIFASSVLGFREILVTIIYGKYLSPEFSARDNLYACNPRAIFRDIKAALDSRGIPCTQDAPLNIAKSTSRLNEQWVQGRRSKDQPVAKDVVSIVDWIDNSSSKNLMKLGTRVGQLLDELAEEVVRTQASEDPKTTVSKVHAACMDLMNKHTLRGAMPQTICGIALEARHSRSPEIAVVGARDSASSANKTSKKPGDLYTTREGEILDIYEVTMKPFGSTRANEALQSLRSYFAPNPIPANLIVKVICRRTDVPEELGESLTHGFLGEYLHDEVIFEFTEISEWLAHQLSQMSPSQRVQFFSVLQDFLNGPRIPKGVRAEWTRHFAK